MLYPGKSVRAQWGQGYVGFGQWTTRGNLRSSTLDGAAFGVMVGLGETYFAAFALALGLGEISAGLISSLPMLAGGILQLVSLRAVHWFGSEKRWVVLCAGVQALAFIPLIVAAFLGSISLISMLVIASLYWGAGLASGPAWNTWMQSIVPHRLRTRYFAVRTRASQLTTLVAFMLGGAILQWARGAEVELEAFAALFLLAMAFRLTSTFCLYQQNVILESQETRRAVAIPMSKEHSSTHSADHSVDAVNRYPANQDSVNEALVGARLLVFLVVMQGMIQLSGPYFAPFLLEELQYGYLQFALLIGVAFATKAIAFSAWARWTQSRGPRWLLWMGSLGIVPIASLWLVSQNFYWLLSIQLISGTAWAAYELGFFLLFFETLPIAKRTRMLTFYNLGNTTAWCCGALIGASILSWLGTSYNSYLVLFGLSSVGRLLTLALLFRSIPPQAGFRLPVVRIGVRVLSVRPSSGGVDAPILPSIPGKARRVAAKAFRHSASKSAC